jgi:fucose permease
MTENLPTPPNVTAAMEGAEEGTPAQTSPRPTLQQSHEGETHDDYGNVDIPINYATKIFALCAALNSCNLGFDIGVSTSVGQVVQDDFGLDNFEREMFVGSLNFFAMFGAISSNYFSDRYGRRQTFIIAAVGFILGIVIECLAPNFSVLMFGRVFVGLGVGK